MSKITLAVIPPSPAAIIDEGQPNTGAVWINVLEDGTNKLRLSYVIVFARGMTLHDLGFRPEDLSEEFVMGLSEGVGVTLANPGQNPVELLFNDKITIPTIGDVFAQTLDFAPKSEVVLFVGSAIDAATADAAWGIICTTRNCPVTPKSFG